jgi:glutathione S-transferase
MAADHGGLSRGAPPCHARRPQQEDTMSALKIYGVPRSRTFRTLWAVLELGIEYELVPVDFAAGAAREPGYLAINPNGQIPALDDDGFRLWESIAINLYLAKKHGSGPDGLYPAGLEDEARVWQWSFWGVSEVERPLLTAMLNRIVHPEPKRDLAAADAAERQLAAPLKVLDGAVGDGRYLLGPRFSVADLNVAGILAWARPAGIDMSATPSLAAWLKNCAERPAARAARQMQR